MRLDRDSLRFPAIVFATGLFIATVAWFCPAPRLAQAQIGSASPVVTSGAILPSTNSVAQIIGTNPTRHSIRICNTGVTNALWVWPGALGTITSDFILAPISSNVITCYTPPTGVVANSPGAIGMGNSFNGHAIGVNGTTYSVEEW